jgi:uncharacterized membrane protein (UPF0127 family)
MRGMPQLARYASLAFAFALALGWSVLPTAVTHAQTCESMEVRRLLPTTPLDILTATTRHAFAVEVAETGAERSRGLMCRLGLPPMAGMLFDFGEERAVTMWMKNTLIPLDMLFIRADGTVRHIARNARPYSLTAIPSTGPVRFVLELARGTATRLGMAPGDVASHALIGVAE